MFSLDALIIAYTPIIIEFIIANKFTILSLYVLLSKIAKKTKTTLDDSILSMIKNIALTIVGKGDIVKQKYEFFKKNNILNDVDTITIKHYEKEFEQKSEGIGKNDISDIK